MAVGDFQTLLNTAVCQNDRAPNAKTTPVFILLTTVPLTMPQRIFAGIGGASELWTHGSSKHVAPLALKPFQVVQEFRGFSVKTIFLFPVRFARGRVLFNE